MRAKREKVTKKEASPLPPETVVEEGVLRTAVERMRARAAAYRLAIDVLKQTTGPHDIHRAAIAALEARALEARGNAESIEGTYEVPF